MGLCPRCGSHAIPSRGQEHGEQCTNCSWPWPENEGEPYYEKVAREREEKEKRKAKRNKRTCRHCSFAFFERNSNGNIMRSVPGDCGYEVDWPKIPWSMEKPSGHKKAIWPDDGWNCTCWEKLK